MGARPLGSDTCACESSVSFAYSEGNALIVTVYSIFTNDLKLIIYVEKCLALINPQVLERICAVGRSTIEINYEEPPRRSGRPFVGDICRPSHSFMFGFARSEHGSARSLFDCAGYRKRNHKATIGATQRTRNT